MTDFIRVTEKYGDSLRPLIINTGVIRNIKIGEKLIDTMIQCNDAKFFFVKESVDDIWRMLSDAAGG
jgi:hypothetical protein